MLRGLYTAAAGMMTQQRMHDTVTQNIANVNTPGYKSVNEVAHSFPEVLISLMNGSDGTQQIGKLNTGVFAEESLSTYTQGDLRETGLQSDFGLESSLELQDPATGQSYPFDESGKYVKADGSVVYRPQAFFTVQDNDGNVRYTRDGSFHVNAAGQLLSSTGFKVLGSDGQPLVLNRSLDSMQVDAQGKFLYQGKPTGQQLQVSVATSPYELVRRGNGVYEAVDPQKAGIRNLTTTDAASVHQGSLEGSNVNTAQSMVDLMTAQRAYEANQKMIQFYDKSLDKTVNEVGRV
ncbi:flagellar basal-body rod protein FlgG [Paenibacillus shirakamiensis]|uniref:Flagellar basal-body rod protein FlgG n=1 Tax=Paenibacillus shirakamiensis TaxID=1265935 RepID=A0ABS4JJC4_9BACL|nr:flagellar hook-basal body protein [Paenibacillus shirakamiensis]MBP2001804.1 flagellar basal-body rod protein FlgG [Paenibacillus shirakamiensis]